MNTVADILVWACFLFGLGLGSYGLYGYFNDTIKPLYRQVKSDNERKKS